MLAAPTRWVPKKYDHQAAAVQAYRLPTQRLPVRLSPQERRERKRQADRCYKIAARTRTPDVTSAAVWLGANTVLRLAREWRIPASMALRCLEAAEHAGATARVGDGSWVGRRPA